MASPPGEVARRVPTPMSPCGLPTAALCLDVPRRCHCFSQLLSYLHGENFAFQCMKPIRIGLVGGSGDHGCNFYRSPSSHFACLPQLHRAMPPASPRVRAASSCRGAAATFQHPWRKMPAMTICEGDRQNQSTACHRAFDAIPSSTEVLKC